LIPKTEFLSSLLLTDFPSGSSINYYDGKLFLVGDDANDILILDTDYKKIDSKLMADYLYMDCPDEGV
jgi:hypothetical protein